MRRLLVLATVGTLAALAVAASAAAKGPSAASLTGPGLDHAIPVKGQGEGGSGTPLGSLVMLGGFFPQVFLETPDPTIRTRPAGDLGPRYEVAYRVPGPTTSTIVQYVYPYAKPSPVTYVRPGQRFWSVNHTHGGWYVAMPGLKATLVSLGLPATPPAADPTGSSSFPWMWTLVGIVGGVVLVALLLRRRDIARLRTLKSAT